MKQILLCLLSIIALSALQSIYGQSGNVFHDFNGNGVKDAGEPGVKGIVVKSYLANDNCKGTAVTDSMGNYSLSPVLGTGQKARVEFTIPAAMATYKQSTASGVNGRAVQFVNGPAAGISFAVADASRMIQNDPLIINTRFTYGNQLTGVSMEADVVLGQRNSWGIGSAAADGYFSTWNTNPFMAFAKAKEVGSVYGVAFSRKRNMIYTSAFFRQFTGFGPSGPGAIYKIPVNVTSGVRTAAPSLLKDVTTLSGQSMPADPHGSDIPTDGSTPVNTDTRFSMVGKYSLGDLEMSADESKLYTVNLYNREVLAINPDNGSLIGRWAIPTSGLTNTVGTVNGNDVRPFGLGIKDGKLYVGAVCTAQSTQTNDGTAAGARGNRDAMHGYVWELNETTGTFTLVFDFKIRGNSARWNTWQDSWNNGVRLIDPSSSTVTVAQPMLADIDFYGNDIIVGLRNRLNDQWGVNIYDAVIGGNAYSDKWGDLLGGQYIHATGKYVLETGGAIGSRIATGTPGVVSATFNEFYRGDGSTTDSYGYELATGSFVQLGGGHLVSLQNFPSFSFNLWPDGDHAGLVWMNNETGAAVKGYSSYSGDVFYFPSGKTNGLGGIEALVEAAPIEVGDRVWDDANGNGIQDADEDGKAGVVLELYNAAGTTLLGTTTTDANGNYSFNNSNVSGGIKPNTTYKIRIAISQYNAGGMGTLAGSIVTAANISSAGMAVYTDNDGVDVAGRAEVTFTTGEAGDNDLTIDFGMKSAGLLSVASITSFTAVKNGDAAQLNWTTTFEDKLNYFEVERSTDGRNWQALGRVQAAGNSTVTRNYQYADRMPVAGVVNFYRLKQVGTDNEIHYSETRAVKFSGNGAISVYPNPARDRVAVNIPAGLQNSTLTIKVLNMNGQAVAQNTVQKSGGTEYISVNSLPQGLYHIIIRSVSQTEAIYSAPLQVIR